MHLRKPFDQEELFDVIARLAKLSPTRQPDSGG